MVKYFLFSYQLLLTCLLNMIILQIYLYDLLTFPVICYLNFFTLFFTCKANPFVYVPTPN
jgi:hypothetical protein